MRINSGIRRGLVLLAPETADVVRPTSDKLRQAVFNILLHADWAPRLVESIVLDVFAGTGALGLEAISRGAAEAIFMENHPAALQILKQNIVRCKFDHAATLIKADALHPPAAVKAADILFLDPPYGHNLAAQALTALHEAGWVHKESLVIVEMDVRFPETPPVGFREQDQRKYGNTAIAFWQKI